jgi:hypothetical protein
MAFQIGGCTGRSSARLPLCGGWGRAGGHLPHRGALLLSCTEASVAAFSHQTLASDDTQS